MRRRKYSILLAGLLAVCVPAELFAQRGGGGGGRGGGGGGGRPGGSGGGRPSGGGGNWSQGGGRPSGGNWQGGGRPNSGNWNQGNWNRGGSNWNNNWNRGNNWGGGSWNGGSYYHGSAYRSGWGYPYRYGWGNGVSVGLWLGGGSPYYYGSSGAYYANPGVSYFDPSYYYGTPALSTSTYEPPAAAQVETSPNSAQLTVVIPEGDGQVWLNDAEMQTRGNVREFISPALEPGKKYHYVIRAKWKEGDRVIDQVRKVPVSAGQHQVVDFRTPEVARPGDGAPPPEAKPNG